MRRAPLALAAAAGPLLLCGALLPARGADVDFNREIRPILARHCFKCHGPDDAQRQAGLRLDLRAAALAPTASGRRAIVPGRPDAGEMLRRVASADRPMPPAHVKDPVPPAAQRLLRRWIAAGAEYRPHWAFVAPAPPRLPAVRRAGWTRTPVDRFLLARMEAAGLQPSPRADPYTLVRRVYLDLVGLPPTPEEADDFARDPSPAAYERLVDRLLASPHYGERWARRWLDLARYADTNGYEKDRPRSIWPYRDWVIAALNADMPFDRFTIEQIAGDMLPGAGLSQRVATGFHRNTMLNEEGGIDPLEFRFHAMTDRVATTGTAWLGLTIGCAQCHTHKYDPISHREYYRFFAFLNNADEPEIEVPQAETAARRVEGERRAAALEASLGERFPPEEELRWLPPPPAAAASAGGARLERLPDGSFRASGPAPDTDTYTVTFDAEAAGAAALRVEALADPSLGGGGPGRTPHGNFVLSEVAVTAAPLDPPGEARPVKLAGASADFTQDGFPAAAAIDGDAKTGWAIHGPGAWNVDRAAVFLLAEPPPPGRARWTVRLEQQHGSRHTLGRFRVALARRVEDGRPLEERRREHRERKFSAWLEKEQARAVAWSVLRPAEARGGLPLLTPLEDGSVLASGDQSKRDLYELRFPDAPRGVTALRLEALPDDRLPRRGPGRVYYEGPHGDFFLSEVTLLAGDAPARLERASHTFASGPGAPAALDGDPQTGWSVNGGQGRAHAAVFNLAAPLARDGFTLRLLFERYYAAGLGRFRVSVTTDPRGAEARLPAEVEAALLVPAGRRAPAQRDLLLRHFLSAAPELAAEREAIRALRAQLPAHPTTLVMAERPAENPRPTRMHRRGEFLQPLEPVTPGVPAILHPLPAGAPANRLTFARWLVDPRSPLAGRVAVNRQWAALFGAGLVRTTEDFGIQGELPTHPDLLDFLAILFTSPADREWTRGRNGEWKAVPATRLPVSADRWRGAGWSLKQLHRLLVTSAAYQQDSAVTPALLARDPENRLLARGPRFRLEAELLRDAALRASGLLSPKIGGPSVFPPQPPGVTSEGTYGPLNWTASEGEDRYRRGLYTFSKRTAPYAMFAAFDAPSGEACMARREVSNTPLQALTLLNDTVFVEASRALGSMAAARAGDPGERAAHLFRRCLTRPPAPPERELLLRFYRAQRERLERKELDAAALAGPGEGDPVERAAWTLAARSLLNLDEAVTRN